MRAEDVIATQRLVHRSLDTAIVQRYIFDFMKSVTDAAYEVGGEREVNAAMSSLFYPANNEKKMAGLLRRELFMARSYQVTAEMVEAVNATYKKTAAHIGHLVEEELPSEAGFVWLDIPFTTTDSEGLTLTNRAVSWSPQSLSYWHEDGSRSQAYPGVRLTSWYAVADDDSFTDERVRAGFEELGCPLVLSHTSVLPFGQRFGGHPEENFDMSPDDFAHWMHVLWAFMEMEVVSKHQAPLPRPERRRAQNWRKLPPSVTVITLRRLAARDDEHVPEHRHVDWSCQWVVQGHHRHIQEYDGLRHHATPNGEDREHCAICGARITWVKAHLRGPEGKPLRSPDQLYRLSR